MLCYEQRNAFAELALECAHNQLFMDQAVLRKIPVERRLLLCRRQLSVQEQVCRVVEIPALRKLLNVVLHSSTKVWSQAQTPSSTTAAPCVPKKW